LLGTLVARLLLEDWPPPVMQGYGYRWSAIAGNA
jgi:hypothetical protein